MFYKRILFSLFLFSSFTFALFTSDFYGVIKNIKSFGNNIPTINYPNSVSTKLKTNDKILLDGVILTDNDQLVELALYRGDIAVGFLSIKENSDVSIGEKNNKFEIKINYGRCRVVLNNEIPIDFYTEYFITEIKESCDFGFQSTLDTTGDTNGYFVIFDGRLNIESVFNRNYNQSIKKWEILKFINNNLQQKEFFTEAFLNNWKEDMYFNSKYIPENLNLALEKLNFESRVIEEEKNPIVDTTEDDKDTVNNITITDQTSDNIKKKSKYKIDRKLVLLSFLSFETSMISEDMIFSNLSTDSLGIKICYRPGMSLFNNKFEYGLFFNLNIFPSKFKSQNLWDAFGYINSNTRWQNSEYSFGSDHNGNYGRMVFDIFDDILSKLRIMRYNNIEDIFFIQAGEYYFFNDDLNFISYDFNPEFYNSLQRKTSLYTNINLNFFKFSLYAEDILPKGVYGANCSLNTPGQSFRFKFDTGAFIDCYNAIQFDNLQWTLPTDFYATFTLETFNLPSFGLSFYLNSGLFIPFNLNTSSFTNIIPSGLVFALGSKIRFKDLIFAFEFVKDTKLCKVGMFDFSYTYHREKKNDLIIDYLETIKNRDNPNSFFEDHYFGFRAKMKFDLLKYAIVDFSVQLGASSKYPDHIGTDLLNDIYDKTYLKIIIDSKDRWTNFNINFYLLWTIENIIQNLKDNKITSCFIENNIAFAGLSISPIKPIELNFIFGIHPELDQLSTSFEAGLIIKPIYFYNTKKNDKTKNNL